MPNLTMRECVDAVFKKLSLAYGRDFIGRYEGLDMEDVKSDWMHELNGWHNNPGAWRYALQNLPISKAPNVYEFRALLARAPEQVLQRLNAPKADPAVVKKALDEARELLTRVRR